ncbi:peptide methionine sulfoxide reductase MsrB-like isoform X1 [Tachypleus tridentatus]|uniref:peptide methionine sulfoxide reductase MsrB-like isoform X1 n=1 Tax=Tachypleus tridentatus TaxID=6853 RepID=UPI003FD2AFB6
MQNGGRDGSSHPDSSRNEYTKEKLKKHLTHLQYHVTQEGGTERAFTGKYYKLKDNGKYACVVCGDELFSSETKYHSGCGWPAFWDVVDKSKVTFKNDLSHVGGNLLLLAIKPGLARTEVSCRNCGAHLGHVFDDGPKPTGKRYCINSASLEFKKENIKEGSSEQNEINKDNFDGLPK